MADTAGDASTSTSTSRAVGSNWVSSSVRPRSLGPRSTASRRSSSDDHHHCCAMTRDTSDGGATKPCLKLWGQRKARLTGSSQWARALRAMGEAGEWQEPRATAHGDSTLAPSLSPRGGDTHSAVMDGSSDSVQCPVAVLPAEILLHIFPPCSGRPRLELPFEFRTLVRVHLPVLSPPAQPRSHSVARVVRMEVPRARSYATVEDPSPTTPTSRAA